MPPGIRALALAVLCARLAAPQAGKPIPEFLHGDECLFCHRNDIGNQWQNNRHALTVRQREDAPELEGSLDGKGFAAEVEYFLGSRASIRFLRKQGYGKFSMRTADAWDTTTFGERCAGCHSTGVDSRSKTFAAFGLDCYVCHGDATLDHTKNTSLMLLSKKRRSDAKIVTSICAQCHLRGGKSRSTGLPYANNFTAGEDLFEDYEAGFAKADEAAMPAGERHVYRNVRDVLREGLETTCLSCHRVHSPPGNRHRLVLTSPACGDCHDSSGPKRAVKPYKVKHNAVCEY